MTRRTLAGAGALAAALVAALAAPPLRAADPDAVRLARHLGRAGAAHPLADRDGRIPVLVPLPEGVAAPPLGLLEVVPGFATRRFAPDELAAFGALHPELRLGFAPPRRPLLDVSSFWTHAATYRATTGLDGAGVVVGIVDTGLDVAHPDFRTADGRTRVAWLLTHESPRGLEPELEHSYGCDDPAQSPCAIYSAADLDALIASGAPDLPGDPHGHGTHVASIAAGNGGPMVGSPEYVGVAPGATLVIAAPGFYDGDILRAAGFVFERAAALGMPAVLNVSLGSDYGPHDGTSGLERGLAALVGDAHPGRAITVAAGTSGALSHLEGRGPFGIHTEVHVASHGVTRLPMLVAGATGTIVGSAWVWVNFRRGDRVSVGLEGPGGETWIGLVAPGDDRGYESGERSASLLNNVVDGRSELTADTNGAVLRWSGVWQAEDTFAVLLEGEGDAHLWVTGAADAAPGVGLGMVFERATDTATIAVPASSPALIAVGCTLNRTLWTPLGLGPLQLMQFGSDESPESDSLCYFGGHGPNADGAMKPDLVAPGAYVGAAMAQSADPRVNPDSVFDNAGCPGDTQCHLLDERHALSSGTSMAAPHVAGAAALLLAREPSLTQSELLDVLQAGARYPRGKVTHDYQLGPGALDLTGALAVLEQAGAGAPVDAARSYYVLSMPYVRPDPGYPVEVAIELRRGDGSVATGASAAGLVVEVIGGTLLSPPEPVRAGLFRAAFTAPPGTSGSKLWLDVRYLGRSLGLRELPIAVDPWVVGGSFAAGGGGCAVAGGAYVPRGAEPGPGALVLVGLAVLRRRRGSARHHDRRAGR
ncbi:MAG: S8 family serine peptidase [Polyangiaceae bacterium]|nr:S8 family serine peptidase [Polyangiaceae bacterium]